MLNEKMNYWPYLQLQHIKYQLHLVVLPLIILIMIGFYKKKY
jgi:hypothetical protein